MMKIKLGASFRDPSGILFTHDGVLYRQVNQVYAGNFKMLMDSGLYTKLVKAGLLISHTEMDLEPSDEIKAFKILRPERVSFISYPYEWSFSQLKDAALTTLSIQKRALKVGMSLKDASAYNIQFNKGRPVLIDTLSFEVYREGEPWVAYRQFCQHFLAPLALMAYCDVRLSQLLKIHIDGVPLDLASELLPARTRWNLGLLTHIHLHARAQKQYANVSLSEARAGRKISQQALLGVLENLEATIRKLVWKPAGTEWVNYYDTTNYTEAGFEHKKSILAEWLAQIGPKIVWDLGANTGKFSRLATETGAYVISSDIDPAAVEQNYLICKSEKEQNILPLILDLTNPSPALGWNNQERESLHQRGPADVVLALALIHHLTISNNVPFDLLAQFFYEIGEWLIVEFIPKNDLQVQKLIRNREDIFNGYTLESFEAFFLQRFEIHASSIVRDSDRRLFIMKRKRV